MNFFSRTTLCLILAVGLTQPSIAQNSSATPEDSDAKFVEIRKKQSAFLKTWKAETQGIFTIYSPPTGTSKIISFVGDEGSSSLQNIEGMQRLAAVAEAACPGFSKVPAEPTLPGTSGKTAFFESTKNYCSLSSSRSPRVVIQNGQLSMTESGSPLVAILLLQSNADTGPADREIGMVRMASYIESRLTPLIAPDGTAKVPAWESAIPGTTHSNGKPPIGYSKADSKTGEGRPVASLIVGSTDLKAAMDVIPAAHRPIGLIYTEGAWDSYNMSVTFDPHMLFPNGIAINPRCTTWNPMKPITKTAAMGCGFETYTLEGSTAYIGGKSESINDYQGFKKGERVSLNFSNIGGLANNGLNPAGANATWGGDLTMTPSGQIRVGSWSGATVNGAGFGAYGGSQSRGIQGEYYLDGYMIGVKDAQGNISVSLIWQQDGQYVFLNGEQYNR